MVQLEAHARRKSPYLTLPGWPGTRIWRAQKPSIEPNLSGKKLKIKKSMKFCYIHRSVLSPIVIRDIIQPLIGADGGTHSQILAKPGEPCRRGGERIVGATGVKDTMSIWPTESTK